ncbi:hypothetical protein [Methylobacterium sp. J-077]|uniref:hypothetical protein n=1 Tax=Methylobacterium sp. J-077 TaxID=2836656 RepID=UPI001FB9B91A|nr:hypothetical protein [Methylobacterium sp. J-077]MCJ2124573.1 hypothetical protein [Methylobacterium sp. J-077]
MLPSKGCYGFTAEIASLDGGDRDAFCRRVKAAVASAKPSRMAKPAYPVGMRDSHVRTDIRAGDVSAWGWERLCAVAASLEQTVHVTLVPPGMRAVVSYVPA